MWGNVWFNVSSCCAVYFDNISSVGRYQSLKLNERFRLADALPRRTSHNKKQSSCHEKVIAYRISVIMWPSSFRLEVFVQRVPRLATTQIRAIGQLPIFPRSKEVFTCYTIRPIKVSVRNDVAIDLLLEWHICGITPRPLTTQ